LQIRDLDEGVNPLRDTTTRRALLRKRTAEMGRGQLLGPQAEKVTLDELCDLVTDDYKQNGRRSLARVEFSIARLKEFFGGHTHALDISTPRINGYLRSRLEGDELKPATVQRELAALKRGFRLAVASGLLRQVPHIPMPRARNTREGFFERGDFEAVLAKLPECLRPPVAVRVYDGLACEVGGPHLAMAAGLLRRQRGQVGAGHHEER
jgi:hypothetical protein